MLLILSHAVVEQFAQVILFKFYLHIAATLGAKIMIIFNIRKFCELFLRIGTKNPAYPRMNGKIFLVKDSKALFLHNRGCCVLCCVLND